MKCIEQQLNLQPKDISSDIQNNKLHSQNNSIKVEQAKIKKNQKKLMKCCKKKCIKEELENLQ